MFNSRHSGQVVKNESHSDSTGMKELMLVHPAVLPQSWRSQPGCAPLLNPRITSSVRIRSSFDPLVSNMHIANVMQIAFFFSTGNVSNLRLKVRCRQEDSESCSYYILCSLMVFKSELPGFHLQQVLGAHQLPRSFNFSGCWLRLKSPNKCLTDLTSGRIHKTSYTRTPYPPKLPFSGRVLLCVSHTSLFTLGGHSVASPHPVGTDQQRLITQHLRGRRDKHWKRICLPGPVFVVNAPLLVKSVMYYLCPAVCLKSQSSSPPWKDPSVALETRYTF